jgi:alpha-glucosidase
VLDRYQDRVLIGEIYLPFDRLVTYYGKDLGGAQLPYNFALIHAAWNAQSVAHLITDYEKALPPGGWPNWVLGNHDQARIAARVGGAQARIAAMLLLTLRGTPTMYYGDEIGLPRVEVPPELAQDPWEKNEPGLGVGRDPSRTPMQWDGDPGAGFTKGRPWLPIEAGYRERNVAMLRDDSRSILSLYRALIALRKREPALHVGDAHDIGAEDNVLTFARSHGGIRFRVALNFGAEPRALAFGSAVEIVLSTHLDRQESCETLELRANEGVIVRLT